MVSGGTPLPLTDPTSHQHSVNKPLQIVLWIAGGLASAFVLLIGFGLWLMSHRDFTFADRDLPGHLSGRWDWSTRSHQCDDSSHVIAFSADRKTMTIAMPRSSTDSGWTATYDIVNLTPSRLRGAIRDEKRLTDHGVPVVWDLVMFGPDEYHWHRTDWKPWRFTAGILRCRSHANVTPDDSI
jgi:hypothetical protein